MNKSDLSRINFRKAHFGLLTLHGKESIMAPLLAQRWDARLSLSTMFDTDSLGTFSGEIERKGSPLECALHKARLALELTGADFGLGSEGSFGIAPWGFGVINQELVACVSAQDDWQIIGYHTSAVAVTECRYGDSAQLERFWQNLPQAQGLIIKSEAGVAKGLKSKDQVMDQLRHWYGQQIPDDVRVTYDLRAHQSPLRRINIAHAFVNLQDRLESPCPQCGQLGFWPDKHESGLACSGCGSPTNRLKARISLCDGCGHSQRLPVDQKTASPEFCPECNP